MGDMIVNIQRDYMRIQLQPVKAEMRVQWGFTEQRKENNEQNVHKKNFNEEAIE